MVFISEKSFTCVFSVSPPVVSVNPFGTTSASTVITALLLSPVNFPPSTASHSPPTGFAKKLRNDAQRTCFSDSFVRRKSSTKL